MPSHRPNVALVTSRELPEGAIDNETPLLVAELSRFAEVRVVSWDDPTVDWAGTDLAVIRSTWDYSLRLPEFLDWAGRCSTLTRLANPAEVVRWNSDKGYLRKLGTAGVPVVPTDYLPPGAPLVVPTDHEFVVKPTVGAGAWQVGRYQPAERAAAVAHIRALHGSGATAMIQPYLSRVDHDGEAALIFVDGEYGFAIRKGAVLAPGVDPEQPRESHPGVRPWSPSAAELSVARAALAAIPGQQRLLYARVDLIHDDSGAPVVSELELIEPNLFVDLHRPWLELLSAAIIRVAAGEVAAGAPVHGPDRPPARTGSSRPGPRRRAASG